MMANVRRDAGERALEAGFEEGGLEEDVGEGMEELDRLKTDTAQAEKSRALYLQP